MMPSAELSCVERDTPEWLAALRADGASRRAAIADLHALLLRAARFEVARRRAALSHVPAGELDDLATKAAEQARVAVLAGLADFPDTRRFTTWAAKFALLEAGIRLRRLAWRNRAVVLQSDNCPGLAGDTLEPLTAESRKLAVIHDCIANQLTPDERMVVVALAIDGVPIDVLAERMATTRGTLYQTLHDGRRRLRRRLSQDGLSR
jgi:RNA polymerase sigma-70 factor (ECF subfamily)